MTPTNDIDLHQGGGNPKCTLSDSELVTKALEWIDKLCKSGGAAWSLQVPVNFNQDPDIIFNELCFRLKQSPTPPSKEVKTADEIREEHEKILLEILRTDKNAVAPAHQLVKDYAGGTDEYVRTDIVYKAMQAASQFQSPPVEEMLLRVIPADLYPNITNLEGRLVSIFQYLRVLETKCKH